MLSNRNPRPADRPRKATKIPTTGNLVLSRHVDETIVIQVGDERIFVSVVEIRGDKVRIAVNAPKTIPVHRAEVLERIEREGAKS